MRIEYKFWKTGNGSAFLKKLFQRNKPEKVILSKPDSYYTANHPQEVARRKRQIESGMLKIS